MSLTLDEVKNFLRLDTSDDDTLLEIYISTAEEYVKSACGRQVDLDNPESTYRNADVGGRLLRKP